MSPSLTGHHLHPPFVRAFLSLLTAATALGCGNSTNSPGAGSSHALPALARYEIVGLGSLGPESANASFAVSAAGELAFTHGFTAGEQLAITLVDTLGRRRAIGRLGRGPHEFSGGAPFIFFGNHGEVIGIDIGGNRAIVFDSSGTAVRNVGGPLRPGEIPIAVANDSIDVAELNFDVGIRLSAINRVSLATLRHRTLVRSTDSLIRALNYSMPLMASDGHQVVLANPESSAILLIGVRSGVADVWLPPDMARRDRLRALAVDGAGRLWGVGADSSEAAFGDVYAGSVYLGRVPIPCKLAKWEVSIQAHWLAVMCVEPNSDSGVALRLFRISG